MKKTWWKEAVVYQIYPRSFHDSNGDGIGDLPGVTSRLDYLHTLGVDVIWLSPFYQSPGGDMGYDISDYQAIDPVFGTLEDFDEMLVKAHRLGMKIVIDLVVNHTSEEHAWFKESRKSRDNPYRDYYIWRDGVNDGPPNNWGSNFSGSAWKYDETSGQYYLHTFGDFQPDLNWDNPAVRQEVYKMMRWWCDRGVDGFRMDVISMISKTPEMPDGDIKPGSIYGSFAPYVVNGPRVHEYLQEMNREVLSCYDLLTVGECSGLTVEEATHYANAEGTELSMAFQFEHMDLDGGESFKWNMRKIELIELKQLLSKWQYGLQDKAWNSLYWCNHDQPRIVSRMGDDSTKELRERSAKALALCVHMMQGTPYVFEGEELGMTNANFETLEDFRDVESINAYHELTENGVIAPKDMMRYLRYKSRDNARTPMQWDNTANAGFTTGTPWIKMNENYREINANDQVAQRNSVFHFYRKLIELRHSHEIIAYGRYQLILPEHPQLYAYTREWEGEKLLVVCNLTGCEAAAELPCEFMKGRLLISNFDDTTLNEKMALRPWEAFAVLMEEHTMNYKAVIFDLDGVICSTDEYHYLAWKKMADSMGIYFDRTINNRLRGVSRMESLGIILERYEGEPLSDEKKVELATLKNDMYRESLKQMSTADLSEEVKSTLDALRAKGLKLAIGSSSKNTPFILGQLGLGDFFDAISDGNNITNSKPDPEVFLKAAQFLGMTPADCLVVEDAVSGAQAGHAGNFKVACVGDASKAGAGDFNMRSFRELLELV